MQFRERYINLWLLFARLLGFVSVIVLIAAIMLLYVYPDELLWVAIVIAIAAGAGIGSMACSLCHMFGEDGLVTNTWATTKRD